MRGVPLCGLPGVDAYRVIAVLVVTKGGEVALGAMPITAGLETESVLHALRCVDHPIERLAIVKNDLVSADVYWLEQGELRMGRISP